MGRIPLVKLVQSLTLCIAVGGCGAGSYEGVTRTDSAGMQVVANSGMSRHLAWKADTLFSIGGDPEGPGGFFRVARGLVDVDSAGRIYVLDMNQYRVAVFDATGAAIGTVGGEGDGPGELRFPLSVAVTPGGEIRVFDGGKLKWIRYTLRDGYLGTMPYPYTVIGMGFRHFGLAPSGTVLWARDPYTGSDQRFDRLLWVAGMDTTYMVADRPAERSTASYPECGMAYTIAVPLSPAIYWTQAGDRVGIAMWGQYRVDLFDRGKVIRSIRLGAPQEPISESEAISLLRARGYRGPCNTDAAQVVKRHGFYPYPQVISGVTLDGHGELWVGRRTAGTEETVDVFDSTGVELGSLPDAFPLPLTFTPSGTALVKLKDSLDVERLGIVRVIR